MKKSAGTCDEGRFIESRGECEQAMQALTGEARYPAEYHVHNDTYANTSAFPYGELHSATRCNHCNTTTNLIIPSPPKHCFYKLQHDAELTPHQ